MLIPQLGYGGAEASFLRVARYLSRHADVTIALMARDYGEGKYSAARAEVDLPVVLLDGNKALAGSLFTTAARWWRMFRRLRALKKEHNVTISFLSGANLLNALSGPKEKTIISERGSKRHDIGMLQFQRMIWTKVLDPLTYKRARWIVAASQGLAGEITTANPWITNRTIAIEGTVHTDHLLMNAGAAIEDNYEELMEYETIVAFGRLHVQKGFDFLLRAFSDAHKARPAVKLLLIGDGPEADRLIALAERLGLKTGGPVDAKRADVIFAGYQENPLRFIKLGRIFVLTSRYEGLPNALIEALAAGIPILATDCPWGPRSVLHGPDDNFNTGPINLPRRLMNGTLMPMPESDDAIKIWSREIVKILKNPPQARSKLQCREAIARFDIEVTGKHWMDLIAEVVEHHPYRADQKDNGPCLLTRDLP